MLECKKRHVNGLELTAFPLLAFDVGPEQHLFF